MFWNEKVSSRNWASKDMQLVGQWVGDITQVKSGLRSTADLTWPSVTSRNVSLSPEPRTT